MSEKKQTKLPTIKDLVSDKKTFYEVAKKFSETYNNLIKEL